MAISSMLYVETAWRWLLVTTKRKNGFRNYYK